MSSWPALQGLQWLPNPPNNLREVDLEDPITQKNSIEVENDNAINQTHSITPKHAHSMKNISKDFY